MSPEVKAPSTAPARVRGWVDCLLAWLYRFVRPVINPIRVLWLTAYCTVFFVIGAVFFLVNDQGLDFLRRMAERGFVANLFFFLGVLAWGLSTWYCARLLLTRRFRKTSDEFFTETRWLRIWVPRLGGSLTALIVAGGFLKVALWGGAGWILYALVTLYAVMAAALLVVFCKRRSWFEHAMRGSEPDEQRESLPDDSWMVISVSLVLSWGLLCLFLIFPVGLPTILGAPAILLFAAASWILFGSMIITYWPLANGYPALTLPLILLTILLSWFNDNHTIRTAGIEATAAQREDPETHFAKWLATRLDQHAADRPYPVFVVAAAGGGIRAAYWTASVLGRIADEGDGRWPDHLYAISGVSGGSVGAALHAAQIADLAASPRPSTGVAAAHFVTGAQRSLGNDLLSPVLSFFLFPDLVQRFFPIPVAVADRARAIELAMENASADPDGLYSPRFAQRFVELWPEAAPDRVPALLLNTTHVETGRRAIVSNLRIDNTFADAVDLLGEDKRTQDMPLSTAAHLSARFTYVSPAGTIRTPDGKVWGHVVDGGYFENSGAATAVELMQRMRDVATRTQPQRKVNFILILIRNDPDAPSVCRANESASATPAAHRWVNDLLSPIRALLSTRVARGRLAEQNALRLVRVFHGDRSNVQSPQCENGCVFEFSLSRSGFEPRPEGKEIDPPLGWSLSQKSRESMDLLLTLYDKQFACVRELLADGSCEHVPACEAR